MLTELVVCLHDLGAVIVEVDRKARLGGIPSTSHQRLRWPTLTGLVFLWRTWRREAHPRTL